MLRAGLASEAKAAGADVKAIDGAIDTPQTGISGR